MAEDIADSPIDTKPPDGEPMEVKVVSPVPIPVEVIGPGIEGVVKPPPVQLPEIKLPSETTFEQDRSTLGQRRINLLWEGTQSIVALAVTAATMFAASILAIRGDAGSAAFLLLSNAFFLVSGFYFGRTNHTRTGGTGRTDPNATR